MGHRNRRESFVDRLASGLVPEDRSAAPGGIREYVRMPHEMVGDGDLRPPVIGETAEVRDDEVDIRVLHCQEFDGGHFAHDIVQHGY